jgi:hypothetical protein
MKQYHTEIIINADRETVWAFLTDFAKYPDWNPLVGKLTGKMEEGETIETYIVPLNNTYKPILLSFKPNQELVWQGSQVANFLLAGKHYYRLESISAKQTKLLHGEYFTGVFSYFIPPKLLKKMENVFILHNQSLKNLTEK